MKLLLGDCLEQMKTLADNSVDAVVTDPPYGLSFMGKKWDYDLPSVDIWREVFRVLKPGGHVLSFGGTRTYHRMVVNIEDAGFEIRDQVQWIYGSGFPKSHNVSKAIDKMAGAEREVVGTKTEHNIKSGNGNATRLHNSSGNRETVELSITAPATPEAKTWDGWGSALKPANEPICLARKPLEKGLTLVENVLKYGTGAINIDGTRIGTDEKLVRPEIQRFDNLAYGKGLGAGTQTEPQGRWPANVLFDEDAASVLGEPSRFFYVAKASKAERNRGCEGMPEKETHRLGSGVGRTDGANSDNTRPAFDKNHHPTVKPIKLMEYLITLITPPNGTILDPFMGSGSTGVAARNLNRNFIGIERDPEYMEIAKRRVGGSNDSL
jgi:DNA modification methylase